MNLKSDRKSKRVSLIELPTIPHSFLVTSKDIETKIGGKSKRKNKNKQKDKPNEVDSIPKLRWSFSNFPNINLRGIPNEAQPPRPRPLWSREETFDADFVMPNRVREVLESEGLENKVINTALRPLEEKHRKAVRRMTEEQLSRSYIHGRSMDTSRSAQLPPIVTTHKQSAYFPAFLQLRTGSMEPEEEYTGAVWKNPFDDGAYPDTHIERRLRVPRGDGGHDGEKTPSYCDLEILSWQLIPFVVDENILTTACSSCNKLFEEVDDTELQRDQRKWKEDQHTELLFFGKTFQPPRVILVSSKITKCHLLLRVYNENVLAIVYDFETWTFDDIIDAINKKLETYRKHCKAKSIMVLCQGGPGHIYLLRNFVITPQKLHKSNYRVVLDFWRSLANCVSRINPANSAIHLCGFKLCENDQGKRLLPMLQSLVYPQLVRVVPVNEDTSEGKEIIEQYFKYNRYKIWRFHQNTSVNELDFTEAEENPNPRPRKQRMSIS